MIIVVMGVTGVGKTTVGRLLAARLGWPFHDADDLHAPAHVARMARGIPLTDADRAPWLGALRDLIGSLVSAGRSAVLACSALRAAYRESIVPEAARGAVCFVWLHTDPTVIARRLHARTGHFAGALLLPSQLATLEPPEGDLAVDANRTPAEIVREIVRRLSLDRNASGRGAGAP